MCSRRKRRSKLWQVPRDGLGYRYTCGASPIGRHRRTVAIGCYPVDVFRSLHGVRSAEYMELWTHRRSGEGHAVPPRNKLITPIVNPVYRTEVVRFSQLKAGLKLTHRIVAAVMGTIAKTKGAEHFGSTRLNCFILYGAESGDFEPHESAPATTSTQTSWYRCVC